MKKYRASIVIEYDENDIKECLETGEAFPTDDAIEAWMTDELREQMIDKPDVEFEVFEAIKNKEV